MIDLHIDIETGDPDDLWTLAVLSTHPRVNVRGVSVFPGGRDQIGLVKAVLQEVGRKDIPVAADVKNDNKSRVSDYYRNWMGSFKDKDPDLSLIELAKIVSSCDLFTGGPLTNIYKIQKSGLAKYGNWMCQGGFVGNNIIDDSDALDKFKGQKFVPTFNLNGDPKASKSLLSDSSFSKIRMVGKNVCHGFFFTDADIASFKCGVHKGLDLMIDGVVYHGRRDKAMHDILAALLMINPDNGTWIKGTPVREKGMWGFEKNDYSNIEALVSIDKEVVLKELF